MDTFYRRNGMRIFAIFLLLTPVVVIGARRALQNNSNRVEDWLPKSFEETQRLEWFAQHFVSDDLLMISWEGCTLDDPRLPKFAEALRRPLVTDGHEEIVLWRQLITGPEALERLRQPPLEMSRQDARERLHGWLLGPDQVTSGLIATITVAGWEQRHSLVRHIRSCAEGIPELPPDAIRVAGPVLDSAEIDRASNQGLVPLSLLSFGICFFLMFLLFRSLLLASMIFLNALFCQQLSLALVYLTGAQMDSVLMMVPIIVYVLAVSGGVHIANYYRDAVTQAGSFTGAPMQAVRDAFSPCLLASATTAIGLASLHISFLTPVRKFGTFGSISVVLTTVVLFSLLPSQLEKFTPRRAARRWRPAEASRRPIWDGLLSIIHQLRYAIIVGALATTALGLYGVDQLRASVQIKDMFYADSQLLQDYEWLEGNIGPLVPIEIVLRLPKQPDGGGVSMLLRMQLIERVHQAASSVQGMGAVVSAWNFCPPLEGLSGGGARQTARRSVFNGKLDRSRDLYGELALLRETPEEELWRVSGRSYAGLGLDYQHVLSNLRRQIDPILHRAHEQDFPGVTAVYCGAVPLVQMAQDQMLSDLTSSFLVAFGFIGIVMILLMLFMELPVLRRSASPATTARIVLRCIPAGACAMLPNILPGVVVLGGMGLARFPIEIGSMMTASVALGIAVDDTLHFITWFRRGLGQGKSRREAVASAYHRCGAAMIQTSLICGIGLLAFGLSPFVPMARFSGVMFAMLITALVADLVFLPAILLSPLGVLFESSSSDASSNVPSQLRESCHTSD
ncbi:MAG TPA: MMPL family transporter [Pirellulaceae bacterium]|nr:MMPL family transporter [Pirellulaceae bacterium]